MKDEECQIQVDMGQFSLFGGETASGCPSPSSQDDERGASDAVDE
jgi:hypothetical protein